MAVAAVDVAPGVAASAFDTVKDGTATLMATAGMQLKTGINLNTMSERA